MNYGIKFNIIIKKYFFTSNLYAKSTNGSI